MVERFFLDSLIPIPPKITREPTRESIIKINQLFSGNVVSMDLNLAGGRHIHLALTMTTEDYLYLTGHFFVPPHNTENSLPMIGTVQEQALRTKRFWKNQALFRLT